MKERDEFIDSIYELAGLLGDEVMKESADQTTLINLTALGLQSCLGALATLLEESSPRPIVVPVGSRVEISKESSKLSEVPGTID